METATEPAMVAESANPLTDSNPTDPKAKRKSVSFVDEKLIADALSSTNATTNGGGKSQQVRANGDNRCNGTNKYLGNGRSGPVASSNGKRYPNGTATGHSKGGGSHYAKSATNGAAKSNPVIVYYNDPKAADIDVDQLLTKPASADESTKSESPTTNIGNNKPVNGASKSGAHTNGHSHHRDGHHHPRQATNGAAKGVNGNGHPVKYADNWRYKALRMDQPQYQPMKAQQNGLVNGAHINGKTNGWKQNGSAPAKVANGKADYRRPAPKPQSEPITIYYTAPESSGVIEQNLQQLKLNCTAASEKLQQVASNGNKEEAANVTTPTAVDKAESSQTTNVINGNNQPVDSAVINGDTASPVVPPKSNDQYDVINGGVPIETPVLPAEGVRHLLECTLVSHPGHFYVKFVNAAYDTALANMKSFYNSDEHIDLSVDVLKSGQYFAAARLKAGSSDPEKEWIRVQLLHVESADLINCLLIDQGCFGVFKIADLQPLYNQFRSVPKQAIRASLSGVISKESDWLPKQALEFKDLVSARHLHTGEQKFDQKAFDEKQALEIELYFADGEFIDKSVADVAVEREIASKK